MPTKEGTPSTREAILERAVDLASTDGLEGLTIGQLAADMGLSKSGLLGHLEGEVFPGGCFWAAASAEFDGRPGPVRDRVGDATAAWLAELERQAEAAGAEDPRQLAFELHSLAAGANQRFQ